MPSFRWIFLLSSVIHLFVVPHGVVEAACKLCGDGVPMLNPNGVLTTRQGQTATCSVLEQNAVHLPETGSACQSLQALAFEQCQCQGWNSTTVTTTTTNNTALNTTTTDATADDSTFTVDESGGPFVCSICREGEIGNPNGIAVNSAGQPTRCSVLDANRESIPQSACPRIQAFAFAACECTVVVREETVNSIETIVEQSGQGEETVNSGPFVCPICGDGTVGNPNGIVVNNRGQTARCSALEANQDSVPPNACNTLQALAREPCACQPVQQEQQPESQLPQQQPTDPTNVTAALPPEALCSICGEGEITIPSGIVTNPQGRAARCDVLQANSASIPVNACEQVQAMARGPCGCSRIESNLPPNSQQQQNQTEGTLEIVVEVDGTNSTRPFFCSVCGDGDMLNPNGIVVTRQGQAARCSALNANADTIPENACSNMQSLASIPCGCALSQSTLDLNGTQSQPNNDTSTGSDAETFVCNVCGDNQSIGSPSRRISTSLGVYTCSSVYSAGLIGDIPQDHCDSVRISVAQGCGCFADGPTEAPIEEPYFCDVCSDGRVVTNPQGELDVPLAIFGSGNMTCGQYEIAASRGQVEEGECAILQSVSGSACRCKLPLADPTMAPTAFVCPICGEGMAIGFPGGEVILPNMQRLSCGGLQMRAELNIIQPTECTQIQPFVREVCECVTEESIQVDPTSAPTAYECNICGDGRRVTKPDGVVVIPTQPDRTCTDLIAAAAIGNINPNQCTLLHPFTQSPCGCMDDDINLPSAMPSASPTGPTISPAPSSILMRDDCFASLKEIHELERQVEDTTTKRKYILCPHRTFQMGVWSEDGEIKDGEPFIALRPNVVYQCGEDGSRSHNCILRGGDFGVASYYGVYDGIYETVEGVEIRGLTFESQNLFSVLLKAAGDITFVGCAFKGNSNNVPVLVQWEGEGPDAAGTAQDSRALRKLEEQTSLSHVVTFQNCVFRDNYLKETMSFPGIIENSFQSELVITNCLFENNRYGIKGNPAPVGYAIRSFGPITVDSSCFVDNTFHNYGPILVYGNQFSALNNYVDASQSDLFCEFAALFNSQDGMAENVDDGGPRCELSDAATCAFSQAPTIAPSVGPTLKPSTATQITPTPETPVVPPTIEQEKEEATGGAGSSSSSAAATIYDATRAAQRILLSGVCFFSLSVFLL